MAKQTIDAKLGTEILCNEDFLKFISNDILLAVSNGDDFKRKILKYKELSTELLQKITKPPRYPFPGNHLVDCTTNNEINKNDIHESIINQLCFSDNDTNFTKKFNGNYPILEGNVYNHIMKIVKKHDKIIVSHRNGYISFDYDDNMIFPEIESWEDSLIRECRGLIISSQTGKVLARRFHKFFNINEKNESSMHSIDFDNAIVYEKLDGSLTSPILLDNDDIIWTTRRNRIYDVEKFISTTEYNYNTFVKEYLKKNITPLFEWCHDIHAVGVLCYPKKQLVLLALRDNITGEYYDVRNLKCDIPVVEQLKYDDIMMLIEDIKLSKNREGVVIHTKDNNMYKLKSTWYVQMVISQSSGQKMFLLNFLREIKTLKP